MTAFHYPTQPLMNQSFTGSANVAPPLTVADDSITPLRWFLVEVIKTKDTEENLHRWSSFIGICIAVSGNVLISLALNIQKYAHTRLEREAERRRAGRLFKTRELGQARNGNAEDERSESEGEEDGSNDGEPLLPRSLSEPGPSNGVGSPEESTLLSHSEKGLVNPSYISSPYWWVGLVMMFFGECGNFLAYGFAPASIISPLGVVALISNCVVAPLMLKEPFRSRDAMGVLVSIAGAVVVVWSAEKEETKLGPDEILDAISQTAFEVYFGVTCGLIIILMRLSSRYGHKTITIDLGLVALFGGYTVLSTKGISSLISSSFYHIFQYPIAYLFAFVLASTAVLQVKYINRALQHFDSTQVIPTQFVLFTISVIVGSAVLYRDFETVGRERMLKFVTGCSLTFVGVYLISSKRQKSSSRSSFDDESIDDGQHSNQLPAPIHTRASSSRVDGGISIPDSPTARPSFGRVISTISSNAVSLHSSSTPALSSSPETVARGLQTAATDCLIPSGTSPRKRASESDSVHRALNLMPGTNLMTGYQLQTVISEHVSVSLERSRNRAHQADGEHGEGGVVLHARRSSLSLVMDYVKGKRRSETDEPVEEDRG